MQHPLNRPLLCEHVRLAETDRALRACLPVQGSAWDRAPMSERDAALHNEAAVAIVGLLDAQPDLLPQLLATGHPFAEGADRLLLPGLRRLLHGTACAPWSMTSYRGAQSSPGMRPKHGCVRMSGSSGMLSRQPTVVAVQA